MRILKTFLLGLVLLGFTAGVQSLPTFAANEQLEIRVHKNTLDGDMWTSSAHPIKLTIRSASGTPLGMGLATAGLDATKGALAKGTTQTCTFAWTDGAGVAVNKQIPVQKYTQLPAGEFALPPLRIPEERLILESTVLQNCGGDEAKYQAFQAELAALPANPFLTYREYLSLPVESLLGQKIIVSIAAGNEIAAFGSDHILGYACKVPATASDPEKTGLCAQSLTLDPAQAEGGAFRADLVVVSGTGQAQGADIAETLTPGVNAEFSNGVTFVGNFLIRTTSLLDWALAINDTGLRNEKITMIYQKSLDIVNGLFILALLSIAFLWNFSALLSRERLKKIMILFVIGIIGVNFTLPVTRLLADGTNILERTLLVKEERNSTSTEISQGTAAANPDLAEQLKTTRISASDILAAYDLDFGGFIGVQKAAYLEKDYPSTVGTPVNTTGLSAKDDLYVDRFSENTWFNLALVGLGAIGQLLIALILLFRHIILWFLLIFSPFLLVLALFESTRPLLRSWGFIYARWLLIGPILALTLFIVVNIWSLSGVPLESSYAAPSNLIFPNTTNLYVAAPGITSGYLNTPREVMKYIAALMMLYLAVLLPFWLTRYIPSGISGLSAKINEKKKSWFSQKTNLQTANSAETKTNTENQNNVSSQFALKENGKELSTVLGRDEGDTHQDLNFSTESKNLSTLAPEKFAAVSTKDLVQNLQKTAQFSEKDQKSTAAISNISTQKDIFRELSTRAAQGDSLAASAVAEIQTAQSPMVLNSIHSNSSSNANLNSSSNTVSNSIVNSSSKNSTADAAMPQNTLSSQIQNSTDQVLETVSNKSSARGESSPLAPTSLKLKDSQDKEVPERAAPQNLQLRSRPPANIEQQLPKKEKGKPSKKT